MKAVNSFRTKEDLEIRENISMKQSLKSSMVKGEFKKTYSEYMEEKGNEFHVQDLDHIVHENVTTVEDDRVDKPILSIDPYFDSLLFAIIDSEKVKAVTSLRLNTDQFLANIDNKTKRLKYNLDLI